MDVFRQRLEDEYDANIVVTAPTVPYKRLSSDHRRYEGANMAAVVYRDRTAIVSNPTDFPDVLDTSAHVRDVQEPIVKASVIVPEGLSILLSPIPRMKRTIGYLGEMMDLCFEHRAEDIDHRYLETSGEGSNRVMLTCTMPLSEIVTDFFDKLKSRSSGFASFE
jgi:translation factor GUF1, mitochondrial